MAGKSSKNKSKSKGGANAKHATDTNSEGVTDEYHADHKKRRNLSQNCEKSSSDVKKSEIVETGGDDSRNERKQTEETPNAIASAGNEQSTERISTEAHVDGELRLYPMNVRGPAGEEIELQVSPGDSVMDLRQFLLDVPETSFYTCYDLILHEADGLKHELADFFEIGDVADVTNGRCSLEMVNALYDDRSARSHLRRLRDLLSMTNIHSSWSTMLALEYEARASTAAGEGKPEAPEMDGLGFMDDFPSHIENLIVSPSEPEITCLESIAFSSFNPVPGYRRLVGDLIYLDIATLEGKMYCITAHTKGFYVNSSSGNILDPGCAIPVCEATTLVGLLRKLSDKFTEGFEKVLKRKSHCHPFENVPALLPLNPWLGPYPTPPHKRDISRAEDSLLPPYGTETVGMQRDWNEELQSCREFPRKSLQDRIMRDRALYKVNSDFVDAAVKGSKGVIGRCIPPINPTDPEHFHMYVHNNIFFSFAIDGDLNLIQQIQEKSLEEQNNANENENQNRDIINEREEEEDDDKLSKKQNEGVKDVGESPKIQESIPVKSVEEALESTCSLLAVDLEEKLSPSAPAQVESEQATYASANNDLKGTKAYNNADISGLYTLAMAIIDYRGHRIIAQSIIPGILQGDKSESLLYGSVDNGKKISWNEKFHSKVVDASSFLHIKEHEVYDESRNKIVMAAPVECKGIVGSDDRHYLLDLMRVTPRDANYMCLGSHHCILRPELVAEFCEAEALERKKAIKGEENSKEDAVPQEECPKVLLNPNVLTEFKLAGSLEEIRADEELVKKAGKYLIDVVLPKFLQDLSSLEISPMDGQTLTEAFHTYGINIRYLGKVANMANHFPHILDLCICEMIVRAAKHALKRVLRNTLDHDVAYTIARFLNCFADRDPPQELVSVQSLDDKQQGYNLKDTTRIEKVKRKGRSGQRRKFTSCVPDSSCIEQHEAQRSSSKFEHGRSSLTNPSYLDVSSQMVWEEIFNFIKFKYQFDLIGDAKSKVRKLPTIRNLCLKVGVTLASRKYDFNSSTPFQASDIIDLSAVVKHSIPLSADAHDRLECGKVRLAEGKLNEAYEEFSEGFSILQQVCGPIHREVANCCRYLAMVLYHAGDMAGAIMQQHKELIINERCLGLDHPDTAHSYGNMALFYHGLNQTELALRHMARTLFLLNICSGSDHPDVAAMFINTAMMYQDVGRMHIALRYLQEALQKNLRLLGEEHIQTAVCYHALAIAFNCMGAYKLSLQHERSTYNILVKQLGEDDPRTRDCANWLKTFKIREIQVQKEKGQHPVTIAAARKAAEALKARPDLLQALQAAAGGIGHGSLSKAAATAALAGEVLPRSRGMDERGVRAAAEARKKAVSRGLNLRPQGIPFQGLNPLTELISLINSGVSGKAPTNPVNSPSCSNLDTGVEVLVNAENICAKADISGESNEPEENGDSLAKDVDESFGDDRTPLGLGIGLGARDNKNRKQKERSL